MSTLAAAMGIGRFAYTPIMPLMTAQTALSPHTAGQLATANYTGYLAGAVAATVLPRLAHSRTVLLTSLTVITVSLPAMALTTTVPMWLALRTIAGLGSALAFVVAVNGLLDVAPRHAGWGLGGVGIGIASSAALVLALPADWRLAWWSVGVLAALLSVPAWWTRPGPRPAAVGVTRPGYGSRFWLLFGGYTLEGIGYIIAATFLVAAMAQHSPGPIGGVAWLVVGLSVIPSAVVWDRVTARWSHPALLTVALLLQAAGIALACFGTTAAATLGAVLFGGTFIGVSSLALAYGRRLGVPGAVAVLTAGYSAGQIVGPLMVGPLLHGDFRLVLGAGAAIVSVAALVCAAIWIGGRKPVPPSTLVEIDGLSGESVRDGQHRFPVLRATPDK